MKATKKQVSLKTARGLVNVTGNLAEANSPKEVQKTVQLIQMTLPNKKVLYRKVIDADEFGNAKVQTVTLKPNSNRIDGLGSIEILTVSALKAWTPVMGR